MKPAAPLERRLLNYEALAVYLGISKRAAEALVADGQFVKVPIGSRVLIDKADADAYIERIKRSA